MIVITIKQKGGNIMKKCLFYYLMILIVAGAILSACTEQSPVTATPTAVLEPVTIKLTWFHGTQFLGFYVAQQRGYYAEEGLDVTIEPRKKDDDFIMEQVADGPYDFSVGGAVGPTQAQGVPVTAIAAIYQFGPDAFFARSDSGIVTPADLAGRTVVVKSPGWERMLVALLRQADLTLADVEPVEGSWDMTPFFEGEVEVWGGFLNDEVIQARQHGLDLVILPLYEYGIATVAQTVATSQSTLTEKPDLAVRFLRASLRGWQWAIDHPTEAVDIMLDLYPEMAEDREFHVAAFDASIPLILPPDARLGEIDCQAWQEQEALADVETDAQFCTTEIIEAAWAEMEQ